MNEQALFPLTQSANQIFISGMGHHKIPARKITSISIIALKLTWNKRKLKAKTADIMLLNYNTEIYL